MPAFPPGLVAGGAAGHGQTGVFAFSAPARGWSAYAALVSVAVRSPKRRRDIAGKIIQGLVIAGPHHFHRPITAKVLDQADGTAETPVAGGGKAS
jgi:hypothetical protein